MAAYQTEKKNNILVATCRHILYRKKKKKLAQGDFKRV